MKRLLLGLLGLSLVTGFAGEQKVDEEARYRKTGGMIVLPGKGEICIVNAQSRVTEDLIRAKAALVQEATHIPVIVSNGAFSFEAASTVTMPTVYVVDEVKYPLSLTALEANWGVANVANLSDDQALKELLRVVWIICGATTPRSAGNPLGTIKAVNDLDQLSVDMPEMEELINVMAHIQSLGFYSEKKITYKKACRLGVAPAPTNEVQRAIFEAVKAELSAEPTNPMRIEFDPKTGR